MAAIGSDVPHGFLPQTQLSNPALPAWKVGSVVNTRRNIMLFLAVMLITMSDATTSFDHGLRINKQRPCVHSTTLCVFWH